MEGLQRLKSKSPSSGNRGWAASLLQAHKIIEFSAVLWNYDFLNLLVPQVPITLVTGSFCIPFIFSQLRAALPPTACPSITETLVRVHRRSWAKGRQQGLSSLIYQHGSLLPRRRGEAETGGSLLEERSFHFRGTCRPASAALHG